MFLKQPLKIISQQPIILKKLILHGIISTHISVNFVIMCGKQKKPKLHQKRKGYKTKYMKKVICPHC